jgi:hypothetical protein
MTNSCPWLTRILTHAPERLPDWYELSCRFAITPSRPCSRTARRSVAAEACMVSEKRIGSASRGITRVLKSLRAHLQRFDLQILALKDQQIEEVEHQRIFPARVVLQEIERRTAAVIQGDDLTIDYHLIRKRRQRANQRRITLGEILAVTRLQMDAITCLECDRTITVELQFIFPSGSRRKLGCGKAGDLTLHGVTKPIVLDVEPAGPRFTIQWATRARAHLRRRPSNAVISA